jgi:predicted Zn-ribbon and HTH transcriptional regulator
MAAYVPHEIGTIQTIFRQSRSTYTQYAESAPDILARIDEFISCADWSKGVARIRCDDCGYSFFRPFSCKAFHLCPSCDQKRTILYAEYLADELLLSLPHRQFVFTIPKMLRPYFKTNRRLFGEVSRRIADLLSGFFSEAAGRSLQCGCVVSFQSFGEFARFHPHWHVLVLEGGFTSNDRFVYLPLGADDGMVKAWQETMLAFFLGKGLIDQVRVSMLRSWKHSGFSVESETQLLTKADREALGQYVVRGATSQEKINYDESTDTVSWTAAAKGFFKGQVETFRGFEFVAQLAAHIPPRRVQLVRRYGIYAGKVRAQWVDRPAISQLATVGWQSSHAVRASQFEDDANQADAALEIPDAWVRLRKQSWARLLRKIYEVDPFLCPKCNGQMRVVAIIEDPEELRKIIAWAAEKAVVPQDLLPVGPGPPVPA